MEFLDSYGESRSDISLSLRRYRRLLMRWMITFTLHSGIIMVCTDRYFRYPCSLIIWNSSHAKNRIQDCCLMNNFLERHSGFYWLSVLFYGTRHYSKEVFNMGYRSLSYCCDCLVYGHLKIAYKCLSYGSICHVWVMASSELLAVESAGHF